jgi:hypothetical protein
MITAALLSKLALGKVGSLLKNPWTIIAILVVVVGILLFSLKKVVGELRITKQDNKELSLAHETELAQSDLYITKIGNLAATNRNLQLTQKSMERYLQDSLFSFLQENDRLKRKLKNLERVQASQAQIDTSFILSIDSVVHINELGDTISFQSYTYQDEWVDLKARAIGDSLALKLRLSAQINSITYWQRKKFLFLRIGKKQYFTEVSSENPYLDITGVQSVVRRKK